MGLEKVGIDPVAPERFEALLGDRWGVFEEAIAKAKRLLEGRTIWNVNSTASGGGVAEMLRPLVGYIKGAGLAAEWIAIKADPSFFRVTKRLHNKLHGHEGDGGDLGDAEADAYERALADIGDELDDLVSSGDLVVLHDPQTAGLAPALKARGAAVVWRCHVGLDTPNSHARQAWDFLRPWVEAADAYVFSRQVFVWDDLDRDKIAIIPPSIDAFSPKNQDMDPGNVEAILATTGLFEGPASGDATFTRSDGSEGTVRTVAETRGAGPLPRDARVVVQVSRWDGLKDPLGVMEGFARHVPHSDDRHLVLAGPSVEGVADDPEGAQVLQEAERFWGSLEPSVKERVHLAVLPMDDGDENAAIVNALQRRADVVVQKSLAEGFGLTVAEAMWKARPVVASRIGGIQDQIEHGETGLLLDDPRDLEGFGRAVDRFLFNPAYAERVGNAARERVKTDFLGPRHLMQYLDLIERLI
jgi:trehalose synthase